MKRNVISVALFMASYFSNAQSQNSHNFIVSLKKVAFLTEGDADFKPISLRAIKDFKSRFHEAKDAQWFVVKEGFMSYFDSDSCKTRVLYSAKGNWQYTLQYYGEERLDRDIRKIVKSTYYDYSITGVEEIHTTEGGVYIIHLADSSTIKIIRIDEDGGMDEINEFIKSK